MYDNFAAVLGTASVDLASILKSGRDIINDDVIVTDLRDPKAVVGKLNISVEALAVLQMMKKELKARLAESDSLVGLWYIVFD